jgi:hypothetical protein
MTIVLTKLYAICIKITKMFFKYTIGSEPNTTSWGARCDCASKWIVFPKTCIPALLRKKKGFCYKASKVNCVIWHCYFQSLQPNLPFIFAVEWQACKHSFICSSHARDSVRFCSISRSVETSASDPTLSKQSPSHLLQAKGSLQQSTKQ